MTFLEDVFLPSVKTAQGTLLAVTDYLYKTPQQKDKAGRKSHCQWCYRTRLCSLPGSMMPLIE